VLHALQLDISVVEGVPNPGRHFEHVFGGPGTHDPSEQSGITQTGAAVEAATVDTAGPLVPVGGAAVDPVGGGPEAIEPVGGGPEAVEPVGGGGVVCEPVSAGAVVTVWTHVFDPLTKVKPA